MNVADAYRLVGEKIGVSGQQLAEWVAVAKTMPDGERERWLSQKMTNASMKRHGRVVKEDENG